MTSTVSKISHMHPNIRFISIQATGTLVSDNLIDGRHPCLIGASTGLAPFLSVIKDPQTC